MAAAAEVEKKKEDPGRDLKMRVKGKTRVSDSALTNKKMKRNDVLVMLLWDNPSFHARNCAKEWHHGNGLKTAFRKQKPCRRNPNDLQGFYME